LSHRPSGDQKRSAHEYLKSIEILFNRLPKRRPMILPSSLQCSAPLNEQPAKMPPQQLAHRDAAD
jgi:hypothetical protein